MSCFQHQRNVAKREVQKRVDRTMAMQFSLFSEIFGKPIRPEAFGSDRAKLRKTVGKWIDSAFDTFGSDWNTLSPSEQREKLALFLDKRFRTFARIPKGKHALVWYQKQMEEALALRGSSEFAASYNRYSKATGWLVNGLFRTKRIGTAQEFFSSFAKSEEGFSLAQLFVQQVLPGYASLDRLQARSLQSRDLHKLAKLYSTYSGVYEKLARTLVALNRIRRQQPVDYEQLEKKSMAQIQTEIQREPMLRVLLRAFNRHIRNSIAHTSYGIQLSAKRVTFRDRAKWIEMTWNGFREETVQLSVLVFAISVTPFLHFLLAVISALGKAIGV